MRYFHLYYLLGIILFSASYQNALSQETTVLCNFEFLETALPSDVLLELELSGIHVNQVCDEETGDRIIHRALMRVRVHNYLIIQTLIESGASLLVANNKEETPVILTAQMYRMSHILSEQVIDPEDRIFLEEEGEFLGKLLIDLRQWEEQERRERSLL